VRVVVRGESRAHGALARDPEKWLAEARARAADLGDDDVWLEKVRFETRDPASAAELGGRDDAVAQVVAGIRELMTRQSDLARLGEELAELANKLPPALRDGPEGLRLSEPEFLRRALADVESLLVPRLLARGDE
jgi:exonuclease SbcD